MRKRKRVAERKKLYREILTREGQLACEMNLRLFLEQPPDGRMLFVEDVAVSIFHDSR